MSLSLNNIIIILIGAGAVIAILAIVFFVVYAQRKIDRRKRFAALPTRDAFESEKVDFESGQPERQAESQDWPRHSRTLSDSSDTPLMRTSPHQWTPSPTLPAFTATPYRDAPPERRSPPSRLQELQPVSLVAVGDSARIPLHKKTRSISPELPIHDIDAQMTVPSQPLPASTVPLKINKARRVGSMRTTLLTHLASVRYEQKKPAEDGGDTSPKSIYSQSSFAYSTRRGSRPASVNEEVRPHIAAAPIQLQGVESAAGSHEARITSEAVEQPRLRDSAVFQFPPVTSPQASHSFDEVSLSSGTPLKVSAVEESSPVTLYAEPPAESPPEEVQWRSLRSKLLNTIQDHVVVSENGTPIYESVSRYPSLKY